MERAGSKYFTLCSQFAASKIIASGRKQSRQKRFSRLHIKIINLKIPCIISSESNGEIDRV